MHLCIWAEFLLAKCFAGTSCTRPDHGSLSWLGVDLNPKPSSTSLPSFSCKLWVASTGWPKATGVTKLLLRVTAEVIQWGKKCNRKNMPHYSLRLCLKTNSKRKVSETIDSSKNAFNTSAQIHAVVQFPKWQWNLSGCTVLALKVDTNLKFK